MTNTAIHRAFVQNAKARRLQLGLTQAQVAAALGWKIPQLSRLEIGSHRVFLDTVEELACVLQTTAAELITPGRFSVQIKRVRPSQLTK